jgi:hypothetical protein
VLESAAAPAPIVLPPVTTRNQRITVLESAAAPAPIVLPPVTTRNQRITVLESAATPAPISLPPITTPQGTMNDAPQEEVMLRRRWVEGGFVPESDGTLKPAAVSQ